MGVSYVLLTGCGRDWGPPGPERTETRSIELDNSEEVRVDLKMGAGEMRVRGGADKLMEGRYVNDSYGHAKTTVHLDIRGGIGTINLIAN